MGNLFNLNDRIYAAMDELDAAKGRPGQGEAIELAHAKAELIGLAIKNANTINAMARMQEDAMDGLAMQVGVSRMMLGQPQIAATVEPAALPGSRDAAVEWVRENGAGHSVAWMCTKLGERFGRDFGREEVVGLCDDADVVPVQLGRSNPEAAERGFYAQKARASDGRL